MTALTKNMKTIRVLVFGATGTGKTSLCNTLAGKSRPTDNGAKGVTSKSHYYSAFNFGGCKIELVDTAGLHESTSGTVPAEEAVVQLVELLEKAKDGFSLLLHVTRASRITKEQEEDYRFFVDKVTERQIPVILAVTGCENEQPMGTWVEKNKRSFERFQYRDIIATCFAKGGALEAHFKPLRAESKGVLLNALVAHALPSPYRLYGPGTGTTFSQALSRIWNEFVEWSGLPEKYRRRVNESAYSLMKRLGVPEAIAQAAIKHIPNLVDEIASKAPIPGAGKLARIVSEKLLRKILSKPE